MRPNAEARVTRFADIEPSAFGPLSEYRRLTGDDGLPVFTGVQTCRPGYATPLHWHPYVEYLFVLDGSLEAWLEGQEADRVRLGPGDLIALPACVPHVFRNAGTEELRILGIHAAPNRVVHRIDPPSEPQVDCVAG